MEWTTENRKQEDYNREQEKERDSWTGTVRLCHARSTTNQAEKSVERHEVKRVRMTDWKRTTGRGRGQRVEGEKRSVTELTEMGK